MGNKRRKELMKKWTTIYGIQFVTFLKLVYSISRYFSLPALIPHAPEPLLVVTPRHPFPLFPSL